MQGSEEGLGNSSDTLYASLLDLPAESEPAAAVKACPLGWAWERRVTLQLSRMSSVAGP